MDPIKIKAALERRGNFLNSGIDPDAAIRLAKTKDINFDPYILNVFAQFNGFREGALDPGSCIRIWPVEEIVAEAREGERRSSFADFLIHSNKYTADLADALAPVFLEGMEAAVASSFPEFLRQLVGGELDF